MGVVARGVHSPPFSKEGWLRLNKKIPFLSGADGVVSNMPRAAAPYRCSRRAVFRPQRIAVRAPFSTALSRGSASHPQNSSAPVPVPPSKRGPRSI